MTKRQDRDAIYVKRQFDTEIIVVCVRWYITYRLSYRDLVAMMTEPAKPAPKGDQDLWAAIIRAADMSVSGACNRWLTLA